MANCYFGLACCYLCRHIKPARILVHVQSQSTHMYISVKFDGLIEKDTSVE